ncbi:MAG: 4'-phosphopantetheinyl transferase superfamily protein [Chloroflexota bacterium]
MTRAHRYRFEQDRNRFIVARGALRSLLGLYVEQNPRALSLQYNEFGKPTISAGQGAAICFNTSHSAGMALYAVTRARNIGVDLEILRDVEARMAIAERFFSPSEVFALRSLPLEAQSWAFLRCWTRKEAYVKARGKGLFFPLDRFSVSLRPGEQAALLEHRDSPHEIERWTVLDVSPTAKTVAAIVVEGHDWRLRCWNWDVDAVETRGSWIVNSTI